MTKRIDATGALVDLTKAEQAAFDALPPPPPPAAPPLNFLGFLALFTADEQAAIVNSTDPRVKLFCLMAAGAAFVDLTDPRVAQGTKLLEAQALIAAGRADQVLAGQAAPTK